MDPRAVKSNPLKVKEMEGDTLTPISIFHRLSGKRKFLLESSLKHEKSGRYSFIGSDPYLELKAVGGECEIHRIQEGVRCTQKLTIIDAIHQHLSSFDRSLPFPFYGGGVGYIGYDAIRQYENIGGTPADDMEMPDAHLMFYEQVVVMDHQLQKIYLVFLDLSGNGTEEQMAKKLHQMEEDLKTPSKQEFSREIANTSSFHSTIKKAVFEEKVKKAQEHIKRGDIFQVVLSQRLQAEFKGSPFSFYRKLRRTNPSPYMFYIDFDDYLVLGASPESLVSVKGEHVLTNPIAGTRRRGMTEEEDQQLEKDLLSDEKELAEHRMLVDLGRNDLGRVCEIGSVELTKFLTVERYKHVMHIVSEVKGKLRKNVSRLDALLSCLPAGTVSGAPKIRAMQIINELEVSKRGVYAGAVGYINVTGEFDFALAIRTMVIKANTAYVQAGAGIVLDSVPQNEYEETIHKAKALLEVKG
ncbi:anthranilate synthase component I [Ornithinibacillus sp. L9]|uniref:Anthranilate synthase component 1 n=1 Tax=Ornithinibacillus caprae TaxID=2678566 RepID=A0A6N8FIY7_9BACI|nr:anthranilate synthase component I [Ornithinibacillus caprae]MUK87937.1 anthranilate synthase component I [Ornithinibacillus caprae]